MLGEKTVTCENGLHNIGIGLPEGADTLYKYTITISPDITKEIYALLSQDASDLEVAYFTVRDPSLLDYYICFEQFSPNEVDIGFSNQPCQPSVEELTFTGYNTVDVKVRTCF